MSSNKLLEKLQEIRDILINYIDKNNIIFKSPYINFSLQLNNKFNIIELNDELDIYDSCSILGGSYLCRC